MLLADELGREMNKRVRGHSEVILEWRKQRVVVNLGPLQRWQILRAFTGLPCVPSLLPLLTLHPLLSVRSIAFDRQRESCDFNSPTGVRPGVKRQATLKQVAPH